MYVTDNDLFYHYLEVVNDWLYLTGKLPQLKQESMNAINDSARNIARGNYNNPYGGQQNQVRTDAYNPFEIAQVFANLKISYFLDSFSFCFMNMSSFLNGTFIRLINNGVSCLCLCL